jgi:hypothetical protein
VCKGKERISEACLCVRGKKGFRFVRGKKGGLRVRVGFGRREMKRKGWGRGAEG